MRHICQSCFGSDFVSSHCLWCLLSALQTFLRCRISSHAGFCIQNSMKLVLAFLVVAAVLVVTAQEDILRLADGIVQGEVTPRARVFRGIPYAAPPVGPL